MNRRKYIFIQVIFIIFLSCGKDDDSQSDINYKQEMRDFVTGINKYAKTYDADFIIIPQNGIELATGNGDENGPPDSSYLNAIDGNGQEDLFFGYNNDNEATPAADNEYLRSFLEISKSMGKTILVTDYCSTHANMDASYSHNNAAHYISFAANHRELDNIPDYPNPIYGENNAAITTLSEVRNFLYLINPANFNSKTEFINAINSTSYDLLIMDLFFQDDTEFNATEIDQLKNKANGGKRLVISYLSIGEAENYRYYWQSGWDLDKPAWIDSENPEWEGNFKVKYWDKDWQNIIYGNDSSYLKKIMNADFDGVYLDIIDAFEYFE